MSKLSNICIYSIYFPSKELKAPHSHPYVFYNLIAERSNLIWLAIYAIRLLFNFSFMNFVRDHVLPQPLQDDGSALAWRGEENLHFLYRNYVGCLPQHYKYTNHSLNLVFGACWNGMCNIVKIIWCCFVAIALLSFNFLCPQGKIVRHNFLNSVSICIHIGFHNYELPRLINI